jgi:hypothetical protein
MKIRNILSRRGMAGFGIAALAAGVLATVPSAANAAASITLDTTRLMACFIRASLCRGAPLRHAERLGSSPVSATIREATTVDITLSG